MKNIVKELKYDDELLESLGVIPFTLRKDTLNGEHIISWTTSPKFYPEEMKSGNQRVDYVFGNVKRTGLDEMVMPDQPKDAEKCHEITYEEIVNAYKTDLAHKEGTLWDVPKNYDAVFMRRSTHYQVAEDFGRSISLVYPAADCAIIRMYDKKNDVIGITHSDIAHTSNNIIKDMVEYMKEHFGSNVEDIMVMVGSFAQDGMIWDKYPPFAEEHKEVWNGYIEKIDDTHYNVNYGDRIYDQLIESGIPIDNIYFDKDNTIENREFFSNNRSKLQGERQGRNLYGITFDSLPVFESQERGESSVILK